MSWPHTLFSSVPHVGGGDCTVECGEELWCDWRKGVPKARFDGSIGGNILLFRLFFYELFDPRMGWGLGRGSDFEADDEVDGKERNQIRASASGSNFMLGNGDVHHGRATLIS